MKLDVQVNSGDKVLTRTEAIATVGNKYKELPKIHFGRGTMYVLEARTYPSYDRLNELTSWRCM